MKTKIKRHSRSVLAVILTLCMLVSCMTVGIIATDAAKVQSESVGNTNQYLAGQYLYIDMASSNRTLHGVGLKYWDKATEWAYKEISDSAVTDLGNGVYRYDLSSYNSTGYSYFSTFRVGTRNANNDANSWKEQSITSDATTTNNKIIVSFSNDNLSLSWGTYTPAETTYTVTYGVESGSASHGTLSAAIGDSAVTSGQSYDYGSSVTFTAVPATDYKTEWYSDSACTAAIDNTGNTYTTTLTDNLTVYVKYVEKDAPITIYVCDNEPLVSDAAHLCFYTFHGSTPGATGAWAGCTVATAQNDRGRYTTSTVGTIDSKTVYKLELDPDDFAADTGIIINGEGNQTSDLTLADGQIYFTKTENNVAGSQDVFDQSMLDGAVQRYVIAGTKGLVGSDPWSTTSHIMKYNSNGTYTITFNNVAASPEYGTLAFKVIKYDSNWVAADHTNNADNVVILSNANQKKIDDSGNIAFTTTKKSNVTITYNPDASATKVVTISAAEIPATNLTTTFYVNKNVINGLYVWTDEDYAPWAWSETASNVSDISTTETPTGYKGSGTLVKLTFDSDDATFKFITRKGTNQSSDSASYPIGGTYVIDAFGNTAETLGGGGSNSDEKWDAIFVAANKVPSEKRNKYLLKSNNAVPNSTNFTSTGLDAYVSDGKIYFLIPYATVAANKYFMLVGTDNDYTSDWYQITNNSGNSITNVFVDTSASEYLTAAKKEYYGQETNVNTNTKYFYSQVNIQEGAENTFSNVVLEIDPAQSKRTFTYYTYGATPIAKMPKVVVENGSYGYQSRFGTAAITTPASGWTSSNGTWWTTYRVDEGTQLYITTTIKDAYRGDGVNDGMYVFAYSVNGVRYDVETSDNINYVNTKPITVGTDDIEVTPVYYSRAIDKNKDYISVYVEADSELLAHWGKQVYVYSYYYGADQNSGTSEHEGRMDGNYPGQTLVLDPSGYYYGKIAKCYYSGNYFQTKDAAHPVSGVTFSGGYENNEPHHNFINYSQNRQTYDYDDFKYIAQLGYDTVRLDLKYKAQTSDSNQHMLIGNAYDHPDPDTNKTPATIDANKVQGWEYLYDFDYESCSVLGLSAKVAKQNGATYQYADDGEYGYSGNQNVRIVSVGNQYVEGTGTWATYWYVYKNTGTLDNPSWEFVTKGLPSDFICRTDAQGDALPINDPGQTAAWKAIVAEGLQYTAASIAYEAEMGAEKAKITNNTGHRIDGRWIYTLSTNRYEVHAGVAIYNPATGTYTLDNNNFGAANPEGTAKASAYIDGSTTNNRNANVSTKKFTERNVDANLSTETASSDYYFAYWALVKGTQPTDSNLNVGSTLSGVEQLAAGEDPTTKITASTNQFFVAVYKPITGGKLILKHDAYTTGGLTGTGNRYIKADIVQSNGTTVVSSFAKSKDQVVVTGITNQMEDRGYRLRITLSTASLNSSIFNKFWLPDGNAVDSTSSITYNETASGNGKDGKVTTETDPATYTFTVALSDLATAINAANSDTGGTNKSDYTITYKSDLDTGYTYEITYSYTSRYWGMQTYTSKGTFTTDEFAEYIVDTNGTLTFNTDKKEAFLAAKSPYEDNFKETVKWKFSAADNLTLTEKKFSTTVTAEQTADKSINIKFVFPFEYNNDTIKTINQNTNEPYGLVPVKSSADGDRIMKIDTKDSLAYTDTLTYLDWYSLNDCKNAEDKKDVTKASEPFLIEAPDKIYTKGEIVDGKQTYTEWTFQYWTLSTYPTANSTSVEYKKCYSRFFNLALYQSTVATPVYKVVTTEDPQVKPATGNIATINFLENSRNQWNYNGGGDVGTKVKSTWQDRGDRLFSDFVLTFEYNGKTLKELDNSNYKTGIVIESVGDLTPDAYGEVTTKTPDEYKAQYEPNADVTTTAKNNAVLAIKGATDATLQNGASGNYLFAGVADMANLDDKNSIEFAYSFANISQSQGNSANPVPTTRKDKVYRAFSYVYDKTAQKVVISDAIYFTIYDMASITSGEAYTG